MPITHFVTIDDKDVSPWVLSVNTDMVIASPDENYTQQADITLSNVNGQFEGAINVPGSTDVALQTQDPLNKEISALSKIVVILYSFEYTTDIDNPDVYAAIVFAGLAQKADYGFAEVRIQAGTADTQANAYLKKDIHIHGGQDAQPALVEALKQWQIPVNKILIPDIKRREWHFLGGTSGKSTLDYLANSMGQDSWMDENGKYNNLPPTISHMNDSYTGRMKMPAQSESAIGLCNKVEVRGAGFLPPGHPGSANLPSDAPVYETTQEDLAMLLNNENGEGGAAEAANMLQDFGWLRAPTFYFPELSTRDECRKRALRLLARYITYWNRSLPTVVGRSPQLASGIHYRFRRMLRTGWLTMAETMGRVVRCKTNYSSRAGWTANMEIQPFVVNAATAATIYEQTALGTWEGLNGGQ